MRKADIDWGIMFLIYDVHTNGNETKLIKQKKETLYKQKQESIL